MPSNRAYLDPDIVKPTKYIVPPTRIAKEPPVEPWELPKFEPYVIDDYDAHGEPNLLNHVDTSVCRIPFRRTSVGAYLSHDSPLKIELLQRFIHISKASNISSRLIDPNDSIG